MKTNTTLTTLYLVCDDKIEKEGGKKTMKLKWNENNDNDRENNNYKWKWKGNNIGESGATAISESLKTNTTLTILVLWAMIKRCKIQCIDKDQFIQSYYIKNVVTFLSSLL